MASKLVLAVALISSLVVAVRKLQADATENNVGVIGGKKIRIEDAPYMAFVYFVESSKACGGSIIHERFILTVAHCIFPSQRYQVRVGSSRMDEGGEIYDVEKAIPHELYNNYTKDNDIGLLKLASNLTFSDKVNKILLDDGNVTFKVWARLNITGWGCTKPASVPSKDLLQASVQLLENSFCSDVYKLSNNTDKMLCTLSSRKGSCQGDSGGPLTLDNVQVGVTSFSYGLVMYPSFYTKVSAFTSWVEDTIALNL